MAMDMLSGMDSITAYDAAFADMIEWVPDLMWPQSVWTFGQMRTDPQLRAILTAYTLPIRRASWIVDGTGCRPEVAAMVANNLGLMVAGVEDTAPNRGPIRWERFLRLALLNLTFGHMPFEKLYDVSTGTATLARLAERMPQTIYTINILPDDALGGIRQHQRGSTASPFIPAERLAWFAHDREGAAWQGQSLLRPSYGAWLLKRELWRVNATSLRRNGMGVPTVTAPAGATPGQIMEAQRLASAHRVGDQSGVGLPSGFSMELKGITGSVPDPLGFINYLDQQMTRSVLAGVVDLGNTANGSRALGDTFVDLLMLSLQAIADDMAEVVTHDIAADLVRLNYGDTEPVPTVRVGEMGQRNEVTSATLKLLLDCGALTADPGLEAYVRDEWNLPPRAAPPSNTMPPIGASRVAAGQSSTTLRRALTPVEAASKVNFAAAKDTFASALDKLLAQYSDEISPAMRDTLMEQVTAAVKAGDMSAIADLSVNVPEGADLLFDAMTKFATAAAKAVAKEAAAQGVKGVGAGTPDAARLTGMAQTVNAMYGKKLSQSAASKALQVWSPNAGPSDVAQAVGVQIDSLSLSGLADMLGSALSTAMNEGRTATLDDAPPATYYASEVLDDATCNECESIDGTAYDNLDDAESDYANGGYNDCEGGLRCRGIIIAVWDTSTIDNSGDSTDEQAA